MRFTREEPQQFMNDRSQMQFFRREQGKAFLQIEAHLMPKYAHRTGSRSILANFSMGQNMIEQIQILLHAVTSVGVGVTGGSVLHTLYM